MIMTMTMTMAMTMTLIHGLKKRQKSQADNIVLYSSYIIYDYSLFVLQKVTRNIDSAMIKE